MELNDITYKIRGATFTVHKELSPGLLESVYESVLAYELMEKKSGILVNFNASTLVDKESLLRIIN